MLPRLRIVIIGGSDTARQLIMDFLSRPFIDLVAVADLEEDSPGARAARQANVPFVTDIHDLAALDPRPDLVLDVCGKPHVDPALDEAFPEEDPLGPAVVHDTVARLILSLVADSRVLAPGCGPQAQVPRAC